MTPALRSTRLLRQTCIRPVSLQAVLEQQCRKYSQDPLKTVTGKGTGKNTVVPPGGKPFRLQLQDSIQQRIAREHADQQRFAEGRDERSTGRNVALTFSECVARNQRR